MKMIPVHDKIVVKLKEPEGEKRTESGLILPDTAQQGGVLEAKVRAVSEGVYTQNKELIPIVVKEGDDIIISKHHGGQEYKLNGEELLIMSQNEVLSIIGGDDE